MLSWSTVGTLVLGGGGLITGILALFSARSNKNKVNSEVKINLNTAEQIREKLYQSREEFWRSEVETLQKRFNCDLTKLRNESAYLRSLIDNHLLWDWEVVRALKLAGIELRDPPTLHYIKEKLEEL
jgi:hypothetical protein